MTYQPERKALDNLARYYLEGKEAAHRGEPEPRFWELIDLGYSGAEAKEFIVGHRSVAP